MYETGRGLFMHKGIDGNVEGYIDLFSFNGKDLIILIDEQIAANGSARILDVGCGVGRFLVECKEIWNDQVQCVGVSAYPYHSLWEYPDEWKPSALHERLGIEIKFGDAQSLPRHFPPESFDVVTAVHVAQYLPDPMAMLKGIYRVLRLGGIALINDCPLKTSNEDSRLIREFLQREYGFRFGSRIFQEAHSWDVGLTKTRKRLLLPITYKKVVKVDPGWEPSEDETFVVYKYKPSK